jgi:hypothetical protein
MEFIAPQNSALELLSIQQVSTQRITMSTFYSLLTRKVNFLMSFLPGGCSLIAGEVRKRYFVIARAWVKIT